MADRKVGTVVSYGETKEWEKCNLLPCFVHDSMSIFFALIGFTWVTMPCIGQETLNPNNSH